MTRYAWAVYMNEIGPLFVGWLGGAYEPRYQGEPLPVILFRTKKLAAQWAKEQTAMYRAYPKGHYCRTWRFRPVRVCQRIEEVTCKRS